MRHYIVWYNEEPEKEQEDYVIIHAHDIEDARNMADEMFGEYLISVEPYKP